MTYDPESCTGSSHSCRPLTTQRHHVFPKYLSGLLGIRVVPLVTPLCGACHDAVHHLLSHLISDGAAPGHVRGAAYWHWVELAWMWWQVEVLKTVPTARPGVPLDIG